MFYLFYIFFYVHGYFCRICYPPLCIFYRLSYNTSLIGEKTIYRRLEVKFVLLKLALFVLCRQNFLNKTFVLFNLLACYLCQVLYFEDFLPSSIPQSSLNALTSIGWKSYGLTLVSAMDQGGCALLEWGGNVSSYGQINVALHCYHRQYPTLNYVLFSINTGPLS